MRTVALLAVVLLAPQPAVRAQAPQYTREDVIKWLTRGRLSGLPRTYAEIAKLGKPVVPVLLSVLDHPDAKVRGAACSCLGEMAAREALGPLIARLSDVDAGVRGDAAWALGAIRDRAAVPALVKALDDQDQWVGHYACQALGWIGDSRASDALMALVTDKESGLRLYAIRALGEMQELRAVPLLVSVLGEDRMHCWGEHIGTLALGDNASEALANIGKPAADALIAALDDEDPWVRERAAMALAKVRDWRAVYRLAEMVRGDGQAPQYAAAGALAALHDRRTAPQVIGWLPKPEEFDALKDLAPHGNGDTMSPSEVRAGELCMRIETAGAYLHDMGDRRAIEPLIALAGAPVERAQLAALYALSGIRHPKAFDYLVQVTAGKPGAVRDAALEALGGQRTKRAYAILAQALKDATGDTLQCVTNGIVALGDVRAVPLLMKRARSDGEDRVSLLLTASRLGRTGLAAVRAELHRGAPHTVADIVMALEERNDVGALPLIRPFVSHTDSYVAEHARDAVYSLERAARDARRRR